MLSYAVNSILIWCSFIAARKVSSSEDENSGPLVIVNTGIGEMPEGAVLSDGENDDEGPNDDPHRALDIDLDELVSVLSLAA